MKIIYSTNDKDWRKTAEHCIIEDGNRIIQACGGESRTPPMAAEYFWNSDMCTYLPDKHIPTEHDEEIIKTVMEFEELKVRPGALLYTEREYLEMPESEKEKVKFYETPEGEVKNTFGQNGES